MEKGCLVRNITPDMEISGIFILVNPSLLSSRNGSYWRIFLTDVTGSLEGKIWPPKSAEYKELPSGLPVIARGRSVLYRDQLQLRVEDLRYLTEGEKQELDKKDFLPVSKRDIDEMMAELRSISLEVFRHGPWRRLFQSVFGEPEIQENFKTSPAARSVHHTWVGGLLEHTLGVAKLCLALADLYPDIDRQTLLSGALYHDLGKIREFSSDFSVEYTDEGQLQGHGYLGLEMLLPHISKSRLEPYLADHLKHLILSHHGLPEYGATKIPATPEAFILHFADNTDARMAQCQGIFEKENVKPGSWSSWQKTLDRKLFHALPTPDPASNREKSSQEGICLSLLKE